MKQPDLFKQSKVRCDGNTTYWTPQWESYESDLCSCCREDCEGCVTETRWRDTAEPDFHRSIVRHPTKEDHFLCLSCHKDWLNFAGVLKKVYSPEHFLPFMNSEATFLKALRKKA